MAYNLGNMKTIPELNSKWWYRLVKILYVFTFIIIVIFGTALFFTSSYENEVDYNKTAVVCSNGVSTPISQVSNVITQLGASFPVKATDVVFHNKLPDNFELLALHFGATEVSGEPDEFDVAFRALCSTQVVIMKDGTRKLVPYNKFSQLDLSNVSTVDGKPPLSFSSSIMWGNVSVKNYDISTVLKSHTLQKILYSIALLLCVLLVFEVIRRSFYYVVLGSLKPSKK